MGWRRMERRFSPYLACAPDGRAPRLLHGLWRSPTAAKGARRYLRPRWVLQLFSRPLPWSAGGGLPGDRFVGCIQNHDQIGNRSEGERLGTLISSPAQRLAATLLLLGPHLPLIFMGEEYGDERPFQFFCSFEGAELIEAVRNGRKREFEAFHAEGAEAPDPQSEATFDRCRLSWSWEDQPQRAGLRRLYRELLAARRSRAALRNFSERTAKLHHGPAGPAVLEVIRGSTKPDADQAVQALCNLTAESHTLPSVTQPTLLFSSESKRFDGVRDSESEPLRLLPFECLLFGSSGWKDHRIE